MPMEWWPKGFYQGEQTVVLYLKNLDLALFNDRGMFINGIHNGLLFDIGFADRITL